MPVVQIVKIGIASPVSGNTAIWGEASEATLRPPTNVNLPPGFTGEAINAFDAVSAKSDGTYMRARVNINAAPVAPTVSDSATASTVLASTRQVRTTYVTAYGESTPSPATAFNTTLNHSMSIAAYTGLDASITSVNIYVDNVLWGTAAVTAGSSAVTVVTAPSATSASPPTTNAAFKDNLWRVAGFADSQCVSGGAVNVKHSLAIAYVNVAVTAVTHGQLLYLSASVYGGLQDTPAYPGAPAIALALGTEGVIWIRAAY